MKDFCNCLDAMKLAPMRPSADLPTVGDDRHGWGTAAVSTWKKCWWYWGGPSVSELSYNFSDTDWPWVCYYYQLVYEQRLGEIAAHICCLSEDDWSSMLDDVLAISRAYDQFYTIENLAYWARDIELEFRKCHNCCCVFLGWNNVEAFALPPQQ